MAQRQHSPQQQLPVEVERSSSLEREGSATLSLSASSSSSSHNATAEDEPLLGRRGRGGSDIEGGRGRVVSKGPHSPPPLASDTKTFMSAIIAFLGSGVLGFPFAFKQTGLLLGTVLLIAVAALTAFCMLLIVECKYQAQARYGVRISTYGEIGSLVLGRTGELLVNVSLVVSQAGFSVAYLIFISTNVHAYFGISKQLVVLLCIPPLVGFCLLKHIKQLAYVAIVADIMNFTGLAVVYVTEFSMIDLTAPGFGEDLNLLGTLSTIPFFFGVATYCFAGIGMALPLENAMENKHHFRRILLQTVVLISTLYGTFGVCGYLAFGDATENVITLNFDGHGGVATTVKLCLCVGLLCACPIMLFPVFEVLQPTVLSAIDVRSPSKFALFRSAVVLAVALIAGGAPNFGLFISFIGSTSCSILGFVLPVIFHLMLFGDANSPAYKHLLYAITVVGSFAVVAGFYTAVTNML